ncbi:DUF4097 family beta strand repeat-containing protein [Deinococcus sp. YIM 77859]|uniref:DUF4097 family beta strand repeat-containing protein n=1 Tax=Deinococcus sp. YIM 77859 TaxID=1540221 RepID=UPI0005508434|nr:DUF4097 family beta strand repeat-containing protein [Deinococcus sp. YIM 77859]
MITAERTPPQALAPVLARIALGLGVVAVGTGLAWSGLRVSPTPGLDAVQTPLALSREGAAALSVRLEGDRTDLAVAGLPWPGREALKGAALHRKRNPLEVRTAREGDSLNVELRLNVRPLEEGKVRLGPPSLQHRLNLELTRGVPVTLTTDTQSGDTRLDLHALRIRALNVRSGFGDVVATLPERQSGPLTFVTLSGDVKLRASGSWRAPSLRVNTESGDVTLDLGRARAEALNIGTRSGDVTGTLPRADHQSVTSGSGDLTLALPAGAAGTLDLRSEGGKVALRLPPGVRARVRFTDRTALRLPSGLVQQGNAAATSREALNDPDLDLFVDAPALTLTRREPPTPEGAP